MSAPVQALVAGDEMMCFEKPDRQGRRQERDDRTIVREASAVIDHRGDRFAAAGGRTADQRDWAEYALHRAGDRLLADRHAVDEQARAGLVAGGARPALAHALQQYRKGERQHALMTPQAAGLSDQDIADLAAFFASRPGQLRDLSGAH